MEVYPSKYVHVVPDATLFSDRQLWHTQCWPWSFKYTLWSRIMILTCSAIPSKIAIPLSFRSRLYNLWKRAMSERQLSPITSGSGVYIREFKNTDLQDCREIFTRGMEQLINLVARIILPKYLQRLAVFSAFVLPIAAMLQWSVTTILLCVFTCFVLFALLYVLIYVECWKFINACLETDLENIEKSYMSSDGSHMWVAEWNGKVVGMVGLVYNDSHKPGIAELQRMSVSPGCRRMGIARKLLDELLKHAKDQQFAKVELTTTSAQTPAIGLYKKYGFKLKTVFPYHLRVLADLQYSNFELQFWLWIYHC